MTAFLRAVYQGAVAAGWEPMDDGRKLDLPSQSLAFRRPGGRKGIVFAKPEHTLSISDMVLTANWCVPQGLRMVWITDRLPMRNHRDAPFVQLIAEVHVQPPKSTHIIPVAEFVELSLMGWFRFSDDRGYWVWSNPATDPEALEKQRFKDAASKREALRNADMLRGR